MWRSRSPGCFSASASASKRSASPRQPRYGHNFKRLTEEWTTETILHHRYMPVSIIAGILFLPSHAERDRPKASSLNHAVEKFRGFQGRTSIRDDFELLEKIYVGFTRRVARFGSPTRAAPQTARNPDRTEGPDVRADQR
jgi:hypothetical protein